MVSEAEPQGSTRLNANVSRLRSGGRVPELDGLRGIAVLTVMIYHFSIVKHVTDIGIDRAYYRIAAMGWAGVDLFFVLSGFLITGILLEAKGKSKHYFRSFYLRRVLRIFPLYYAYLAAFFIVLPLVADRFLGPGQLAQFADLERIQLWLWLYASNLWTFSEGVHTGLATSHFWSLAIEEQFYLVWPLVVFLLSRGALRRTCVVLIGLAFVIRVALEITNFEPHSIYTFTPSRMDTLLSGALLAIAVRSPIDPARLTRIARWTLITLAPVCFAILWLGGGNAVDHVAIYTVGYSLLCACFTSMLVLGVLGPQQSRYKRFLRSRWLHFLGTYSYGLYVIHVLVRAVLVRVVGMPIPIGGTQLPWQLGFFLLCTAVTIVLALLSWNLMEKRFLALKRYFPY
jgi:peptidoglycan/LPS O-acetylase OafA/YrhL